MGDKRYLMACNHVANASTKDGNPVCAICGCTTVTKEIDVAQDPTAGLEGRMCECSECGKKRESKWTLPFFKYRPDKEYDESYDGCYGWD